MRRVERQWGYYPYFSQKKKDKRGDGKGPSLYSNRWRHYDYETVREIIYNQGVEFWGSLEEVSIGLPNKPL